MVVWRSEDVVACNDFSGLRDLYCRLWMETDSKKKRDTDTHWRCKNGKVRRRRQALSFTEDISVPRHFPFFIQGIV